MRRWFAVLGAAMALVMAMSGVAEARVSLVDFKTSPSCTTPGGSVNWRYTYKQDEWYKVDTLYSTVVLRDPNGAVVDRQDSGPEFVSAGTYSRSGTLFVPADGRPGDYTVTVTLGSSKGGSQWGTASRTLKVRSLAVFC
jgi:hypothetical protein